MLEMNFLSSLNELIEADSQTLSAKEPIQIPNTAHSYIQAVKNYRKAVTSEWASF